MKTKQDLAIEILGNYENYGCELKQQVFEKVLTRLEKCKRAALLDNLRLVENSNNKRAAASFSIFVLTGIHLFV